MKGIASTITLISRAFCLIVLLAFVAVPAVHAADCPPKDGLILIPIPGDPDEKGEVFREGVDDKGNMLQQWCVLGRRDPTGAPIHGTDWGFRYTSANKKVQVWVGGCFFLAGRNDHSYVAKDENMNGIPDEYLEAAWFNIQPPGGGNKDWHFYYNPASNKLRVWKTKGKWTVKFDGATGNFVDDYITTLVIGTEDSYLAPPHFVDIKYKGKFIEDASGPVVAVSGPQIVEPVFDASVVSSSGANNVSLTTVPFAGSGTQSDPFQGVQTNLFRGDQLTVTGVGISDPIVSERAAQSTFGGWVVESYSSGYVIFQATVSVTLEPGTGIDGFQFQSDAPITGNPWILTSCSLLTTSFGNVEQDAGQALPLTLAGGNATFSLDQALSTLSASGGGNRPSFGPEPPPQSQQRIFNCN